MSWICSVAIIIWCTNRQYGFHLTTRILTTHSNLLQPCRLCHYLMNPVNTTIFVYEHVTRISSVLPHYLVHQSQYGFHLMIRILTTHSDLLRSRRLSSLIESNSTTIFVYTNMSWILRLPSLFGAPIAIRVPSDDKDTDDRSISFNLAVMSPPNETNHHFYIRIYEHVLNLLGSPSLFGAPISTSSIWW
jgi:hypothetical protein